MCTHSHPSSAPAARAQPSTWAPWPRAAEAGAASAGAGSGLIFPSRNHFPSPFRHLQLAEAPQRSDVHKMRASQLACLQNEVSAGKHFPKIAPRLPVTAAGSHLQRQRTCFAELGFQPSQRGREVCKLNFCIALARQLGARWARCPC